MIQLSLFRGVHDTQPRPVTLEELVTMMRTDQSVRDLTEKHRYARATGDEQGASRYKKMMASFGVAARFEGGRQQKHIVEFTGLSLVDIDHIAEEEMPRVLTLVRNDPHTLLAYTTLSGQGVRVLTRYEAPLLSPQPKVDARRGQSQGGKTSATMTELLPPGGGREGAAAYKQVFEQINEYYQNLTGLATDHQCKNVGRISTIAYDEGLYYNPDATPFIIKIEEKKPVGRPRKRVEGLGVRVEGDRPLTPQLIRQVLAKVEAQGIRYEAGTYNKYVCSACYEMNRYGVPEEECRKWAVNEFDDYDTPAVEAIVHSCYSLTEEHGTARPPRAAESRYASIKDIQDWLTENNIRIRHNLITRKREMETPSNSPSMGRTQPSLQNNLPERPEGAPHRGGAVQRTEGVCWEGATELTDQHVNSLYCRFCLDTGRQAKIGDFYIIIESDFYPEYHPLKEYLESLPAWDGVTDYIDQLASTVHVTGCTQEMHNRFFKKWMVAMVAAWLDDSTTNHEILTYIGEQGKYKTSFMTHLLPPALDKYFAIKHFNHSMSKDDRLALTELALIDLEELDNLRPEAVNLLKAVTTDPAINLRPVWERYALRRQHIASFCGTGNNPRFLTDLSGNRRWLAFMVDSIDSPWERTTDYDGIYAQAYALWKQGFRYWFDDEENAELERHNRQFEEPNIEEELILTYLRQPYGEEVGEFLTATRIIELVGMYVKCQLSPKRVSFAMNRLGYRQRRVGGVRGYNVIILTGNDIKEQQRLNARESTINE